MSNQHTYHVAIEPVRLLEDYNSGMTQVEIAKKYGVTQRIVWRLMKKCGIQARKAAKRNQAGPANASWKGDAATYAALHIRVEVKRGKPKQCEICGTRDERKHYDWASLTGKHEDINDFKRMCRSCHAKYDNKSINFNK